MVCLPLSQVLRKIVTIILVHCTLKWYRVDDRWLFSVIVIIIFEYNICVFVPTHMHNS